MDLGAYIQIGTLDGIAEANGIEVARLRGYRLMRDEKPVNIEEICKDREVGICEELCAMAWNPKSRWMRYGPDTDPYFYKFIINYDKKYTSEQVPCSINWDIMTDDEKEVLKAYIEKRNADFVKEWEMWNKYCGKNDVLYIHARQGTANWSDTDFHDYEDKPWYLDGCNDADDSSYCDMYAKIEPFEGTIPEDDLDEAEG